MKILLTPSQRRALVLEQLAAGAMSVSQLGAATGLPLTSAWVTVHDLVLAGAIRFAGYGPNPGRLGGQPLKLYGLTGMTLNILSFKSKQLKNARRVLWQPEKPRINAGSGVVAGRIIIGRGSRWGAGLV